MTGLDYERHDAVGLAELVRDGEVTADELVTEAIERIDRLDPVLNAITTTTIERAWSRLAGGPVAGPFAGVPFLLKDLGAELKGVVQRQGSRSSARWVPDFTGTLAARFEAAGFLVLGRTNTPEFGLAPVTEPEATGVTENPWRLGYTPGGSSGGSAAAVAAGIVPSAHASDGGGSIRIPASHCGLFGLKPTRGRTPAGPLEGEHWYGMALGHVVSRSVRDSAAILDAIHGPEPGDPYVAPPVERPFASEIGADPGRLRIGVLHGGIFHSEIHPECRKAVNTTVELLEDLGHQVSVVTLPPGHDEWSDAFLVLAAAAAANVVDLAAERGGLDEPDPEQFELATWILSLVGRRLTAAEFGAALGVVRNTGRTVASWMEDLDVLVTSTLSRPPFPHGDIQPNAVEEAVLKSVRKVPVKPALMLLFAQLSEKVLEPIPNTPLFNMTGQPAMSVPLHWTRDGLPVGVQFAGHFGDEATLFRLASQLEEAAPWFDRRPPLVGG